MKQTCEALDGNDLRQPLTALQSRVISVTGSAEEIDAAPYILDGSAVKDGSEGRRDMSKRTGLCSRTAEAA